MLPDRFPAVLDSAAHYNLTTFIRENQLSRRIADLPHLCGRRERENGGIHPPASMQIILAAHRHGGVFSKHYRAILIVRISQTKLSGCCI